ncbi:hypothetical protein BDV11DRAFT_171009 [Aspergillus similis]
MARVRRRVATAALSRYESNTRVNFSIFSSKIGTLRERLKRPLTYAEKVLYSHLDDEFDEHIVRGQTQLRLKPVRIARQDATAQMALIQFIRDGEESDLPRALETYGEVYDFMESACQKYEMGFWRPGAGIIHQIVLENYAYPASMTVGTDSHTPNADGMGMIAIGDTGCATSRRAVGLGIAERHHQQTGRDDSVKGGTGSIIEYFGPGAQTLAATGMATVCNMGAETGATTSIFPYTASMTEYLRANRRPDMDADQVIDIDLSSLEPHINGPFTPDLSTSISKFGSAVKDNEWPSTLTAGLIGSCTNSSFHDLGRAASVAQQALDAGMKPKMQLLLSPGSFQTRNTLEEAGIMQVFKRAGAIMLPNACWPCCGSWDRTDMQIGTKNSIITSYNRNFSGRLDSNPATNIFLASPEGVMAKVFSSDLAFDPIHDALTTPSGESFKFKPPTGDALPSRDYRDSDQSYVPPPTDDDDRSKLEVSISPKSQRQQKLSPFAPWNGQYLNDCLVLK